MTTARRERSPGRARGLGRGALLCVALLALPGFGFYATHRNLADIVMRDLFRAPALIPLEMEFSRYWDMVGPRLKLNPKTGVADFAWVLGDPAERARHDDLDLGIFAWHQGDFAQAVRRIEAYQRREGESEKSLFWLAMSYLRLGEARNCLALLTSMPAGHAEHAAAGDHADDTRACTLPLSVFHRDEQPSRTAARLFEKLLDEYDSGERLYQWLLNFSYMTVGGFPDQVPPRYRIEGRFIDTFYGPARRAAEAKYGYLVFHDRARELGVDTLNAGKGVAVEDYDGDGWLDIVTGGNYSGLKYYRNLQGHGFADLSEAAGLTAIKGVHVMTAADYDNDGRADLFVSRPNDGARGRFVLLRNQGDGTFRNVTESAGLLPDRRSPDARIFTWASAWADLENDGDLDLFVANFGLLNPFKDGPMLSSRLYLNEGGHFTEITERFGLGPAVEGQSLFGAAFGDYDRDGFPDLAITRWGGGAGLLLHNVGGRRFEATDLVRPQEAGFMTAFLDANQDGRLDLFYPAAPGLAKAVVRQAVFGEGEAAYKSAHSAVWLQRADGSFSADNGFFRDQLPIGGMGSNYGDLNNDGAFDFYIGTGSPEGWYLMPKLMYLGELRDGRPVEALANVSALGGFGNMQKGHGIVFFDFDEDGDEDVYSSLGGMWPGDIWPNQLLVNDSKLDGAWTKIRLRGTRSNRFGVGARIEVVAHDAAGRPRVRYYQMDNKTAFGSAPYLAHIGLADAVAIDRVEVTWPGDRRPQVYAAALGQLNVLEERRR